MTRQRSIFVCAMLLLVSGQSPGTETGQAHQHHHARIEVSSYSEIPALSLEVTRDPVSGWNLRISTENFRFAPQNVNGTARAGEGHMHLYVDGEKVARLYGAWFHLADLSPGRHTIRVTLNANDHAELVLHGEPIAASVEIVQ